MNRTRCNGVGLTATTILRKGRPFIGDVRVDKPERMYDNWGMAKQALSIPKLVDRIPDEIAAYEFLEQARWPVGPVCPHCGNDKAYYLEPKNGTTRATGKKRTMSVRRVWKCASKTCRKQFSVLTGTVMHGSKISVRTWVFVLYEWASCKNGISAREVARKYEITEEAAWYMCHRIREAMKRDPIAGLLQGTIVADETWLGGAPANRHASKRGPGGKGKTDKTPIVALVHRETGEVRSHIVPNVNATNLRRVITENVEIPGSTLYTDESASYFTVGREFKRYRTVIHGKGEYVRGDISTNVAESYFAQLKRSIDGTHHNVSVEHLPRYLAEWDFRFSTCSNTDAERMAKIIGGMAGRRLTYRPLTNG